MAMIAYKCPEIQVVVVDINQVRPAPAATTDSCSCSVCKLIYSLRVLPEAKHPRSPNFRAWVQVGVSA